MTGASNPSWTTQSTTFTAGWWKFWRTVIRMLSASIHTPRRPSIASAYLLLSAIGLKFQRESRQVSARRILALVLCGALFGSAPTDLLAQSHRAKKRSSKSKPAPCKEGCKTDTTSPELAAGTPEDGALQKELAELGRGLRTGAPVAYDHVAAFAKKHEASVWGARAALALGYQDYSKNRAQQALVWLKKAEADTMLREYA